MSSYRRTVVINETPERIFDYVTEQENLPVWSPQVVKSEVKGGGPVNKGSILMQTRRQGNRSIISEVEVIRHDRPTFHTVSTQIMGVIATFSFVFENHDGVTKVSLTGEVKGKGFGVLLAPLLTKLMERGDDKVLENLKEVIESK